MEKAFAAQRYVCGGCVCVCVCVCACVRACVNVSCLCVCCLFVALYCVIMCTVMFDSLFITRSEGMTCSICMEVVLSKNPPSEQRFGILSE